MVNVSKTKLIINIASVLVVVVVFAVFFFIIYVAKCDSDEEHERLKSESRNIGGYVLVNIQFVVAVVALESIKSIVVVSEDDVVNYYCKKENIGNG